MKGALPPQAGTAAGGDRQISQGVCKVAWAEPSSVQQPMMDGRSDSAAYLPRSRAQVFQTKWQVGFNEHAFNAGSRLTQFLNWCCSCIRTLSRSCCLLLLLLGRLLRPPLASPCPAAPPAAAAAAS